MTINQNLYIVLPIQSNVVQVSQTCSCDVHEYENTKCYMSLRLKFCSTLAFHWYKLRNQDDKKFLKHHNKSLLIIACIYVSSHN